MSPRAALSRPPWLVWIAAGVVWGLLCVGVRLTALRTGHDMDSLLARRHALVAQVQELERSLAEAKRYERIESQAYSLGFIKPRPHQLVIVAPEPEEGLLARLFGTGGKKEQDPGPSPAGRPGDEPEDLVIRPREEVVVKEAGGTPRKPRWKRTASR